MVYANSGRQAWSCSSDYIQRLFSWKFQYLLKLFYYMLYTILLCLYATLRSPSILLQFLHKRASERERKREN